MVLFGAAETAELVHAAAEGSGLQVVGIVDSDPSRQGRRIGALTVGSPDRIENLKADTVLITSFGHAEEIHRQIHHLEERGIRIARV